MYSYCYIIYMRKFCLYYTNKSTKLAAGCTSKVSSLASQPSSSASRAKPRLTNAAQSLCASSRVWVSEVQGPGAFSLHCASLHWFQLIRCCPQRSTWWRQYILKEGCIALWCLLLTVRRDDHKLTYQCWRKTVKATKQSGSTEVAGSSIRSYFPWNPKAELGFPFTYFPTVE